MTENRFKARQQKRAVEEESRLEQAKGGTTSVIFVSLDRQYIFNFFFISFVI